MCVLIRQQYRNIIGGAVGGEYIGAAIAIDVGEDATDGVSGHVKTHGGQKLQPAAADQHREIDYRRKQKGSIIILQRRQGPRKDFLQVLSRIWFTGASNDVVLSEGNAGDEAYAAGGVARRGERI